MTPAETIEANYLEKGRHIRNDSLAKKLGCTVDEAQKHLDRYRKEHGERVRGAVVEAKVAPVKKPRSIRSSTGW